MNPESRAAKRKLLEDAENWEIGDDEMPTHVNVFAKASLVRINDAFKIELPLESMPE
jgi:hypothetical protein